MASFLNLPRELRDSIYQASLVSLDNVDISEVNIDMRPLNPDLKLKLRGTWRGEIVDPEEENILDPVAMTYQMSFTSRVENLSLNLFLVNRQIYSESRQVFYEQNRFRFSDYYLTGIPACLAFLFDRPQGSLRYIRDVQLDIGRYLTIPLWYHIPMRFLRPLCDRLTQNLSLRSLGLSIYSYGPDVRQNPWRTGYNTWQRHEDWEDNPATHKWVHELLRINGPDKVTVSLQNCRSKAENDAFLDLLRSHMVKRDEHGAITGSFTSELVCPETHPDMPIPRLDVYFGPYIVQ